jgi:ligand-binding SRPBCC domain-containing protein
MPRKFEMRIEDARIQPPPPRPVHPDPARRFRSVAAGVGSEILISFFPIPWVPRRVSWMTRITEFAWNSHFCDEQVRGPFTHFRHRHVIQAEERDGVEGTMVSDEIEFALPFGVLGRVAGIVRPSQICQIICASAKASAGDSCSGGKAGGQAGLAFLVER